MPSPTDRRAAARFRRRLHVRFWRTSKPEDVFTGYTSNLSRTGAFIETPRPLPKNARIRVEFSSKTATFVLECRVAHTIRTPAELRQLRPSGFGLQFLGLEHLLAELGSPFPSSAETNSHSPTVEAEAEPTESAPSSLEKAPPERRQSPAQAALHHPAASPSQRQAATDTAESPSTPQDTDTDPRTAPTERAGSRSAASDGRASFVLRFADMELLRDLWQRELQHGGLFIPTPETVPVDSVIDLKLYLPGADAPILAPARVVVVNPPRTDEGSGNNLLAGIGVTLQRPGNVLTSVRRLLAESATGRQ